MTLNRNICKVMSPVNINSNYNATNVTHVTLDQSVIYFKEAGETKPVYEHFYSSIDKNTYFDPWTGNIGSISDFAKNGWDHKVVCLTYN